MRAKFYGRRVILSTQIGKSSQRRASAFAARAISAHEMDKSARLFPINRAKKAQISCAGGIPGSRPPAGLPDLGIESAILRFYRYILQ